jgi:hypothetical protein
MIFLKKMPGNHLARLDLMIAEYHGWEFSTSSKKPKDNIFAVSDIPILFSCKISSGLLKMISLIDQRKLFASFSGRFYYCVDTILRVHLLCSIIPLRIYVWSLRKKLKNCLSMVIYIRVILAELTKPPQVTSFNRASANGRLSTGM